MRPARFAARLVLVALVAFVPIAANAPLATAASTQTAWKQDPEVVVRGVLAQPAYRSAPATTDKEPKPDLWDEFWKWVKAQLKSLFGPVARAVSASSRAGALVGIGLTVAAVLGLAFVLVRLLMAFAAPEIRAQRGFAGRALAERRSAAELREAASAFAARGDYARAIAALFGAALAALDERALVPFDATRTPGEYRRLVRRARAEAAAPFDDLTAGFVRAAYSGVPAERADFESAERAFAGLVPQLGAP